MHNTYYHHTNYIKKNIKYLDIIIKNIKMCYNEYGDRMEVVIGISNRHVHLKEEEYKILFGDEELTECKPINQPGQFASNQFVTLKNGDRVIEHVRILGPFRKYNQIEISKTDARLLKLDPPVRMSGNLEGSSPITIIGPKGQIELKEGCIIADRHIHITPKQMEMYGFNGLEKVNVMLKGEKGGIICNVRLKVSEASYFELHLDTDDANAHLVNNGDIADILEGDKNV